VRAITSTDCTRSSHTSCGVLVWGECGDVCVMSWVLCFVVVCVVLEPALGCGVVCVGMVLFCSFNFI
jgi:hypothetical protein